MLNTLRKLIRSDSPPTAQSGQADAPSPEGLKALGNAHLAKGEVDAALHCYEEAVRLNPEYAEGFNNLGFLCFRLQRTEEAERFLRRAIALDGTLANAHFNLGAILEASARRAEAALHMEKAVSLNPDFVDAHFALGKMRLAEGLAEKALPSLSRAVVLQPAHLMAHHYRGLVFTALGHLEEAVESWQHAAAVDPAFMLAHYNLGITLRRMGRPQDALACLRNAVALAPGFAEAKSELASLLHERGELDEASRLYEEAISLKPEAPGTHNDLGLVRVAQGRDEEAFACFHEAIRQAPELAAAHHNLADMLQKQGRFDEALFHADKALATDATRAGTHMVKGLVLRGQGRLAEARASLQQALQLDPGSEVLKFAMASVLLALGELSEGWLHYRARFYPGSPTCRRPFTQPEWSGEDLREKSVLVWGDQGIGDEILFASMLPDLVARAQRCVVECAPKLVPLFARSFPSAVVVPRTAPPAAATREGIDVQIAAADAARWLRPDVGAFPHNDGYLIADPERVAYWRARLAAELGPGRKVGFCWRSGAQTTYRDRHYTRLDQWGPILAVPGTHFISLQYDRGTEELQDACRRFGVRLHSFEEVDLFNDLAEAAALTKAMDLVISVATAASRLAAAQGVPTWELGCGTTWVSLGTDRLPWFPSQRLFMRRWDQAWEEIISAVAEALVHSTSDP